MRMPPRFLTPARVRAYPLVAFVVLALVATYDRFSGQGLSNGLGDAFGGDFLGFYTGGHFAREGRARALADPDAQLAFQRAVIGRDIDALAAWVSPPYFAWLFAPFSALPYVAAFVAWVGTSVVAL